MTNYTAPPDRVDFTLGQGDTLTVDPAGTATGTIVNGGTLVVAGGTATDTFMNGGLLLVDDGMVHDVTIGANTLINLASPTDLEGTILINQGSNATDMISFDTPLTRVKYDGETLTVTYGDNQTASYTLKSSSTSYALSVTEIPDPDGGTTLNLRTEATGIGQTPAGVHQHHPDLGVVGVVLHHLFDAHHHWSFA
jgi:autotransporter passenger strand-loop-strand repeat protein